MSADPGYEQYRTSGDQPGGSDAEPARPAVDSPAVAQPGPHPHEAADIRRNAGVVSGWSDPMEGFRDTDEADGGVTPT